MTRSHERIRGVRFFSVRVVSHLVLVLVFAGCPATIQVGAHSMHQGRWLEDSQAIRARAAFELNCPAAQLELMPLAVWNGDTYGMAQQIGVSGCGHRAVYVQVHNNWVLNSSDTQGR
jgi:hypothetical protein